MPINFLIKTFRIENKLYIKKEKHAGNDIKSAKKTK